MSNFESKSFEQHTIYRGDCLEVMPTLEAGTVDLILTDPPYGTTNCKWDSLIPLEQMWLQLKRLLKPDGVIIMTAQTPFDKVLGASNLSMLKYEWIWEKGNATGFLNAKKMPLKAHENVLVFYDKLPPYNPQMTHGHKRASTKRKSVNSECYGKAIKKTSYDSESRYPRSVQFFSSDKQRINAHPTQKPVALMEFIIKTYTRPDPDAVVLDFTMGSGTTGVATENCGRSFIGIEKEQKYFDVASTRIAEAIAVPDQIEIAI